MTLQEGDVSIGILVWFLPMSLPGCINIVCHPQETSRLRIFKCSSEGEAEMPACGKHRNNRCYDIICSVFIKTMIIPVVTVSLLKGKHVFKRQRVGV